jgi:glycine amidinotransferase
MLLEQDAPSHSGTPEAALPAVWSWNEWDPLEEVIVGRLEGATIPPYHVSVTLNVPSFTGRLHRLVAGRRYPKWMVKRGQAALDNLIRVLEQANVKVVRPDQVPHHRSFGSPLWSSKGFCVACPRDGYLVIGDEIIETPMAWRSRYFEGDAYRRLFKDYFRRGARWTSAPRPQLTDEIFDYNYTIPKYGEPLRFLTTEFEPVFDAADFARAGRDIFVTRSNVTNEMGISWLERHLGDRFRIHRMPSKCRNPMHIDSTFLILGPKRALVNPDYLDMDALPPVLKDWELLIAPRPDPVDDIMEKISMCSPWTSINVLSIDEKRVIVEERQPSLIKAFKDWGYEPIPCDFIAYGPFGGAFHCATLDTVRRGPKPEGL